jgi:hypothetical protein
VTRAISKRTTRAAPAAPASNVIMLPVANHASALAIQPMLFAGEGFTDTPPWLIEEKKPAESEPKARKAPAKKKAAPTKAKTAKAKAAPKKRTSTARRKPAPKPEAVAASAVAQEVQPLTRAMAPVVWQKTGPLAAIRFWLRSAGRNVAGLIAPADASGPKLRTRKQLLLELAVLRQENAAMREKLNLPAMPFGRTVADCV